MWLFRLEANYAEMSGEEKARFEAAEKRQLQAKCSGGHSDDKKEELLEQTEGICGGFEWICLGFGINCWALLALCCCSAKSCATCVTSPTSAA